MTPRATTAGLLVAGALVMLAVAIGGLGSGAAATDASTTATTTTTTTATNTTTTTATNTTTTTATNTVTTTATTTAAGTTPPRDLETVVVARYRAVNGSMVERAVLDASTVARAAPPTYDSRAEAWTVPVTLTEDGATAFANALVDAGFTGDGVADCPTTDARNDRGHCLLLVADGEVTTAFAVGERFAAAVESGAFEADRRFVLAVANESDAKRAWRGLLDDGSGPTAATTTTTATGGAPTTDGAPTTVETATTDGAPTTRGESDGNDTGAASTTASLPTTGGENGDDGSGGAGPGFGVGAALGALVAAALALDRR